MSLPYAFPKWATGGMAVAQPDGLPVFSSPIPATSAQYMLKQYWRQFKNQRSALALNTAHPDYSTYYLVAEGEEQDLGGGLVRWERTYCQVPAAYDEYETYVFAYPGIADFTNVPSTNLLPRAQNPISVTSQLHNEFYMVGSGGSYTDAGSIPTKKAFRVMLNGTHSSAAVGAWYATSPNDIITPSGGVTTVVNGQALAYVETCPNVANYYAAMADASANLFAATETQQPITIDPSTSFAYVVLASCVWGGKLVAEDSKLTRWHGNIWMRTTRYVLAV